MLQPKFRRLLSGAWLDLRSLPVRVTTPSRRRDPWQWRHNIGGGDFRQAGEEFLAHLIAYGGLTPHSDVLDIGCGTGRAALALASYLTEGRYTGFDVAPEAIAACNRMLAAGHPKFTFTHADVLNPEYRAVAAQAETTYRFPVKTSAIDVAFAFSVFSHMRLDPIRHYLEETARALRPGGSALVTAYLLTPERVAGLARGEGSRRFKPWRDGSMVMDLKSPERAIAHPLDALHNAALDAGLVIERTLRGAWLGEPQYAGGQDLLVLSKPVDNN